MRGGNERERGREQGASKTVILLFINGLGGMDSSLEVKALVYLRQRHELTSVGKCSTFQGIARDECQYSLSHNNADLILLWVLEGYYKLNFLHEIKGMYEIECTRCVQETAEQGH